MKGKVKFISGDKELYQKFKLGHIIGTGNATVYQAIDQDGNIQCVKEIRLQDNQSQYIFRKQVQLLAKLKDNYHENIVKCRGSYCLQQQKQKGQFGSIKKGYIHMQKGITNLSTYLKHQKTNFSQQELIKFFKCMLDVFAHLQKIQIAHRDIKPSNILIFSQDPVQFKVCDIGAGTAVGYCDSTKQRTVIGTPYYLSPQLYAAYSDKQGNVKNNPYKSDMYSLGLVFLEVCTLKRLQTRLGPQINILEQAIQKAKRIYPNIIGLGKILRKMLEYNVGNRSDFIQMQEFIQQNQYLRSKINYNAKLDPQLSKQVSSSSQISLQGLDKLKQISNLISTGSNVSTLSINISNSIGPGGNDSFQELKKLKYLQLQDLSITIELSGIGDKQAKMLAQGIQKNKKLQSIKLNLWNNNITNQGFKMILTAVKSVLKQLKILSIRVPSNDIIIDNTYASFFNFSQGNQLTHLSIDLSFNKIQYQNLQIVTTDLAQCKSLKYLQFLIEKINTNPVHFKKAIKQFQKLQDIQQLQINTSCNCIRQEGMFALADFCASIKNLSKYTLLVRNSQINDKGFAQFMRTVVNNTRLKQLKLNFLTNQITQKGIKNVQQYFLKLSQLEIIDINLSNNKLDDMGVKYLAKSLIDIKSLKKVRLAFDSCGVTQKGCLYFGRLLSQLNQLKELDLSLKYNDIKFQGIQYLCAGLVKTKKLKKLKIILQGTHIGDYSANFLAKHLLKIKTLSTVDLNLQNCDLSTQTMSNILMLVKQYSKKAQQITIHLRKNRKINIDLYQKIKKQLSDSRIAIKIDNPQNQQTLNSPGFKTKTKGFK